MDTLTLLASLAALSSAIAACWNLRLLSQQTKSAYKPELLFTTFRKKIDEIDSIEKIFDPSQLGNEKTDLYNIGLGAAKNIKVSYNDSENFLKKIIEKINLVNQPSKNGLNFKFSKKFLHIHSDISQHSHNINLVYYLDFSLPTNISNKPIEVMLLPIYFKLLYLLIYLNVSANNIPLSLLLENVSELQMIIDLEYEDIGNQKFIEQIEVKPKINSLCREDNSIFSLDIVFDCHIKKK